MLASIVVEIAMLGLLIANSLRLMDNALDEQIHMRVAEFQPLLNAALSARLFQRDHASIAEVLKKLEESRSDGLRYVIVYDDRNAIYASAGTGIEGLPPLARTQSLPAGMAGEVYDATVPLQVAGETVGHVRFGLLMTSFLRYKQDVLHQGLIIASSEVLLSALLLGLIGYLLTRHLGILLAATRTVAAGDYSGRVPVIGRDEIGELAADFNEMTAAVRDRVEALRRSEQALFREKERAQVTLRSIGDGVITTDTEGRIESLNVTAESLTGWGTEEAAGRPLREIFRIVNETTREPITDPVQRCIAEDRTIGVTNHALLVRRDGREFAIEDSAAPIRDREGRIIGAVLVFHDVSKARQMARQISYQASHDALTGLENRREFERRLGNALASARDDQRRHVMIYLDLDQFKIVNDTSGHRAGDELLRQLTGLLRTHLRERDTFARLGGDEFGVLLSDCSLAQAEKIADGLRQAVKGFRFFWGERVFEVGVSMGVVAIGPDSQDLTGILSAADVACYIAKARGRNHIHVYQADDQEHGQRRGELQWAGRITDALRDDRFRLYFQRMAALNGVGSHPQAVEIFVRMVDERGGLIEPNAFIQAAERFHIMPDIDSWVIRGAFRAIGLCRRHGDTTDTYAINVSGQSLGQEHFLGFVDEELRASGVRPGCICFEITETAAISNLNFALCFITAMRAKGCRFALDDFGSGVSSFGYLKALPIDFLKIDGRFVRGMAEDATDLAMVEAINHIGHVIGVRTIAEFVENAEVLKAVQALGVDFAQGYAIHRPEPFAPIMGPAGL